MPCLGESTLTNYIWLSFGTGSHLQYIPVHEVAAEMNQRICTTLPVFHALTGCDTVSAFCGRGKKTGWNTWKAFPEVTNAFEELLLMQNSLRFSKSIRKHLFTRKGRALENLPPTSTALQQHIKRAVCWNRALCVQQELPEPTDWGWKKTASGWEPLWTTISEACMHVLN